LIFLIPACKILDKVLTYNTCFAFALFSSQEFLMLLENTLKSEFLYNNPVICCATWQAQTAYENFYSYTFKSTAWNPLYKNHPHFSLFGDLIQGAQAMTFQSQGSYRNGFSYLGFYGIKLALDSHAAQCHGWLAHYDHDIFLTH